MPTPTKGPRLGGGPAHERLMLANLATALFEHGRITTTEAKAKRLRPLAERLITFAKRGDLHARRQVLTVIRDKGVVHELFTEIGPRYENRPGGYTRITKIGPRKGDNAPMAVIELVEALTVQQAAVARGRGGDQAGREEGAGQEGAGQGRGGSCGRGGARGRRGGPRPRTARPRRDAESRPRTPDATPEAGRGAGRDARTRSRTLPRRSRPRAGDTERRAPPLPRTRARPATPADVVAAVRQDEPASPPGDGGLVRVRLDLAYDGTDFAGWAVQPGLRTVQADARGRAGAWCCACPRRRG